jgi:hypothetical protein
MREKHVRCQKKISQIFKLLNFKIIYLGTSYKASHPSEFMDYSICLSRDIADLPIVISNQDPMTHITILSSSK